MKNHPSRRDFLKLIGTGAAALSIWLTLIMAAAWLTANAIAWSAPPPASQARVTVHPANHGKALINPAMGWTMHFYSNDPKNYGSQLEPADTLDDFPGLSTVYLRVPWAFVEPEEGRFNWALLDTPAQRWIAKGKRVAFRITCSENWIRFATPEWVKRAGAEGVFYEFGKGAVENGPAWDPKFDDPVFLKKLDAFLAAMAARYAGNPDVAFIDVGSFGLWGEGHTQMSSGWIPEPRMREIVRRHIDLHRKHFPHERLAISDDVIGHNTPGPHHPLTDYALSQGVSLRDDSILVQPPPLEWFHAGLAQAFWPRLPVILEHEHYGSSKARGAWGDGSLLLKAVEDYHASYMSIHWWPRVELEENRELVDTINRRMGYRLELRELGWPRQAGIGKPFTVQARWANVGVAPCYPGGFMCLTLKDKQGGLVSVLVDEGLDMRTLAVGPPGQAAETTRKCELTAGLIAPTTRPGTYDVYASVGRRDGTPLIALPLEGDDGQRRYRLGEITLK